MFAIAHSTPVEAVTHGHAHIAAPPGLWAGFIGAVLALVLIDLLVLHRKSHVIGMREALTGSLLWVAISLAFGAWLWASYGDAAGIDFLTAYVVEKSLSLDNLFVFLLIFTAFGVRREYQHHVLFYGILGALVMRAVFIVGGAMLLERFEWVMYIFAALLGWAAIKTLMPEKDDDERDPSKSIIVRVLRRVIPLTDSLRGGNFFVREPVTGADQAGSDGAAPRTRLMFTPLLIVLVLVEFTDVLFAVDSIPAVLAITTDPFVAFSSNVMAILGLRALYFALAGLLVYVQFLRYGLGVILAFVTVKMVLGAAHIYHFPPLTSLGVILSVLWITVIISRLVPVKKEQQRHTVVIARAAKTGVIKLQDVAGDRDTPPVGD